MRKGDEVTASGLVGAKVLNGLTGTVIDLRGDGRVIVSFVGFPDKALKKENLPRNEGGSAAPTGGRPVTSAATGGGGSAPAGGATTSSGTSAPTSSLEPLAQGAVVVVFGLVGAKELNGLRAIVQGTRGDGRVVVVFDGKGEKALKRDNLRSAAAGPISPSETQTTTSNHPPLPAECSVFIFALTSNKHLNGLTGKVTSPVQEDGTVMVQVKHQGMNKVPRENLRIITAEEEKSLRRSWKKDNKKEKKEEKKEKKEAKEGEEGGKEQKDGEEKDRDRRRRRRGEDDDGEKKEKKRRREKDGDEEDGEEEQRRQRRRDDL